VVENDNISKLRLGADPPANLKPIDIKLRDSAKPVSISACTNTPKQLKFMRDNVRELWELNLVYNNSEAE
jgi:hypothetical protein